MRFNKEITRNIYLEINISKVKTNLEIYKDVFNK